MTNEALSLSLCLSVPAKQTRSQTPPDFPALLFDSRLSRATVLWGVFFFSPPLFELSRAKIKAIDLSWGDDDDDDDQLGFAAGLFAGQIHKCEVEQQRSC
jgi:hypothetical protein